MNLAQYPAYLPIHAFPVAEIPARDRLCSSVSQHAGMTKAIDSGERL